ncbi:MAG: rRNA adenine N(6)-methyltransferase family protein [Clostridiales bacterium]|nr:rRNA adenine N(6)-methyltransferase family protein [Clostridiales bacterium]
MPYNQKGSVDARPKSQHFLTNGRLLSRIVSLSTINQNDAVLEIGTGKGHLAGVLAGRCKTLYTIEIDPKLYRQARRRLQAYSNISLRCGDFLKSAPPRNKPYKVFANIPFSITAQIIRKLSSACNPPLEMWLVMDKGAAKYCLGSPRETLLSLLLKPKWNMRIAYYFRREDFHPSPPVDTVLVHFFLKQPADIPPSQWKRYERFIRHGLRYGLHGSNRLLTNKQISQALKHTGRAPDDENSVLLYVQWLCLFRCLQPK